MALTFRTLGLAPSFVDYRECWDLQRDLHQRVVAEEAAPEVLLLEHAAVYTAGKRTEPQDLPRDGTDVVDVDRGGKLTWHGPGQLVAYPIVPLADRSAVKDYVWRLEEVLINVVAHYGIDATRVDGRAGVWVRGDRGAQDRKIAAIGIRVLHGVTMHGFALNCSNDLSAYGNIIPCGITDASVTTISAEAHQHITPADVVSHVKKEFERLLPAAIGTTAENHTATSSHQGVLA
ncbi:lipoyl(octanoyl) transferase LipB [Zhihengliuella flava]|uniref:Octanoyltransferase n=1 Tax=Zhihengliuella flava TaxID=1285193 RepID=A0A931DB47_9MICC|nr:lipoyl(octanoyl) transferase LipB [Zhihengliuella flava]MBG6085659.1 lipoyl(octanoyl) transferase [Zhihengliuella flava]